VHAASGGSLYRKTSFLLDSLGQRVFSKKVQMSERPHLRGGLASSVFDSDGVATHDREVVVDGILQGYFLSAYTARKLGLQTTGNAGGCHNLIVHPGKHDLRGLLKKMGRGLLVTELLGQGVNYVNGDYSRGAAGYWVEHGEIVHAIRDVLAGHIYVSEEVFGQHEAAAPVVDHPGALDQLTDSELEVLESLGQGKTILEVSAKTRLPEKDVTANCNRIRRKLKLRNTNALIRYAVCWVEGSRQ